MFAVLVSDAMTPFYQNIGSFPTVFFTVLLVACLIFWLIAILGVVDIDSLDLPDVGGGEPGMVNGAAGLLMKLGIQGVPITVSLSFIALFGWTISYNAVHFLQVASFPDPIRWVINTAIFIGAFIGASIITGWVTRPLRGLFVKMSQDFTKSVLGQPAIVRTSRVDEKFGEAVLEDGAAGLILKVRAYAGTQFSKGDKVVLLEYIEAENVYRVISEEEFKQQ